MTKVLSVREILAQLLGGEEAFDTNEKDFKLFKSSEGLEKVNFYTDISFENVVGYITSSTRLFVIEKHVAKDGEITYTAESYYQNKEGVWEDSIAYEYSEYFANDIEDWKKNLEILQGLFENQKIGGIFWIPFILN